MSLTSFIRNNKDVQERIRMEVPTPRIGQKRELLVPPSSNRYSLIGTAFDYLMRFYLQRINPTAHTHEWVAEFVVEQILISSPLYNEGRKTVQEAKNKLTEYVNTGILTDELIRSSLLLARYDPIYRAGRGIEEIGLVYEEDIQELRSLVNHIPNALFTAQALCILNPSFGEASALVGGADADLIIDNMLIDIKTVKDYAIKPNDFQQLIGYYVLYKLSGIEQYPKTQIDKLAIYFSRYGHLEVFQIDDIINQHTFPEFSNWFQKRAQRRS
jgi:hypothetical protein